MSAQMLDGIALRVDDLKEESLSVISATVNRLGGKFVPGKDPLHGGSASAIIFLDRAAAAELAQAFLSDPILSELSEKLRTALESLKSDKKLEYIFGSSRFEFGTRTFLMGILNVTPDSFSDGGRFFDQTDAVLHALQMIKDGADIVDVGGESTRPGSERIDSQTELSRILPVITKIRQRSKIPISVDTYKADVARAALEAGANIVNDISGLMFDERMAEVIAEKKASVVLMHTKGDPKTMQDNPVYTDLLEEVFEYLSRSVERARGAGIKQIMIDPGIGFGKTPEQNLVLIDRLTEFKSLGVPILIGVSRKSFIGKILGMPVEARLEGTAAAVAASIMKGADIVRVHDVREMLRVSRVADAIRKEQV
ncbi:MAG: dihydropteroate synthase [Candidatus Kryptoniota bacterium]